MSKGVITFNKRLQRFEYWMESREHAHSDSLPILMFKYPEVPVSAEATRLARDLGQLREDGKTYE